MNVLKSIILSLALILSPLSKADDIECKAACQELVEAYKAENQSLRDLADGEHRFAERMKEQRDAAYDKIDTGGQLPFYFWVVMGVAGGVVLTRGIR